MLLGYGIFFLFSFIIPMHAYFCKYITTKLLPADVIAVESDWLSLFVPNMCTFSKPLDEPAPSYDHTTGTIKCHMAATYGLYSNVIIVWFVRE